MRSFGIDEYDEGEEDDSKSELNDKMIIPDASLRFILYFISTQSSYTI